MNVEDMYDRCEDDKRPCPECGARVEARMVDVGFHYRIPGMQVRLGPEHKHRCPHWRRERP